MKTGYDWKEEMKKYNPEATFTAAVVTGKQEGL
jgi:hypothetical protein